MVMKMMSKKVLPACASYRGGDNRAFIDNRACNLTWCCGDVTVAIASASNKQRSPPESAHVGSVPAPPCHL